MNEVKERRQAGLAERDALLQALLSFGRGDFSVRLPARESGIDEELAAAFNAAAEAHEHLSRHAGSLAERLKDFERRDGEGSENAAARPHAHRQARMLAGQAQALRLSMNSMLTLARLLAENEEKNLSAKQIDYAQTIYSAGTDLLGVIDELVAEAGLEPAGPASLPPAGYGTVQAMAEPPSFFLRRRGAAGRPPYRGRRSRRPDDGVVLIAHRDAALAAALLERLRANGYEARIVTELATLRTLLRNQSADAVIVGAALADSDGWSALEQLRSEPETRGVPMSMIASHEDRHACLELASGAQALDAPTGGGALDALRRALADDAPGADAGGPAGVLPPEAAAAGAVLRRGRGLEDVLQQATHFLHVAVGAPPAPKRRLQSRRRRSPLDLVGKKVLIVDGDVRDIYAMTGALEQQGMLVMHAEDGAQGIAMLESNPDTDVVLVDAAAPEAGGRTLRLMRAHAGTALPIVALTAPAGAQSRDACVAAGASDCLAKPIDDDRLLALLRAWLLAPR